MLAHNSTIILLYTDNRKVSMPRGFETPPELSEAEIEQSDRLCDLLHGPVIGAFVVDQVLTGGHPPEITEAWNGVRLPVRSLPNMRLLMEDADSVYVNAAEAFNALVAKKTPDHILMYWMELLPEDPAVTLGFELSNGQFEPSEDLEDF